MLTFEFHYLTKQKKNIKLKKITKYFSIVFQNLFLIIFFQKKKKNMYPPKSWRIKDGFRHFDDPSLQILLEIYISQTKKLPVN